MAIFLPFFTHYCLTIMLDEAIVIRHDNGKHYLGNASLKKKHHHYPPHIMEHHFDEKVMK